jgi:hypothetical protein
MYLHTDICYTMQVLNKRCHWCLQRINAAHYDISVSIVTGYRLDGPGSIPARGKISLFSISSRATLGPTQSPIQWIPGVLSSRIKRPEREADYSPPSSVEVENGGAYTSQYITYIIKLNTFTG